MYMWQCVHVSVCTCGSVLGVCVPGVENVSAGCRHKRRCLSGLLFRDDLVLLAESREMLQKQLDSLSNWRFRYCTAKCGVMFVTASSSCCCCARRATSDS